MAFLPLLLVAALNPPWIDRLGERDYLPPTDPHIRYIGRVGDSDPYAPTFHYGGSGFQSRFMGTSLALAFLEDDWGAANWIGVRIDDAPEIRLRLEPRANALYQIAVGLDNRVHRLHVYRRSDALDGSFAFLGMVLDRNAGLAPLPPRPRRRIEFFGDSITAGVYSEAVGAEGKLDEEVAAFMGDESLTNAYWSFASIAARSLKAEAHLEGIGGLALNDGNGWWGGDDSKGLETTFDRLNPVPGRLTPWDFSKWAPQVVVIAIGQCDGRRMDPRNPADRHRWAHTYRGVLQSLQRHYPNAWFVLTTTIMKHDLGWDALLDQMALDYRKDLKQPKVVTFHFRRSGVATPGHTRLKENQEMATELSRFISSLPGVWR